MSEYKKTFNKFQKVFQDEHFCNKECYGRNIQIDPQNDGLFISMVGLVGRGKSSSFNFLRKYFAAYNRTVYLFNLGDIRRQFEAQIKKIYKHDVDGFITLCENKKFVKQGSLGPYRETLKTWLKSTQPAIPGNVFSEFKTLNNEFATVGLKQAMEYVEKGKVVVLDATNTDIARRELIIDEFKNVKSSTKKLIFLENICFDADQLQLNFMSKLLESSDYKAAVKGACEPEAAKKGKPLKSVIHSIIENYHLLDMPNAQFEDDKSCKSVVVASMRDITTRDLGYLNKYVPMHVAKNGSKSTIYTIRRNKTKDIGYIQLVNMVCLKNKTKSIYKTNLAYVPDNSGLAEYLSSVNIKDESEASSYGQEERIIVKPKDVQHLL